MLTELVENKAITDPLLIGDLLNAIDRSPLVAFDTETTGLDFKRCQLHGVAIGLPGQEWYVTHAALDAILPELARLSRCKDKGWIGWNTPFDLHFLKPYGFYPAKLIDAQTAAYLIDENESLKLKDQARLRLGIDDELPGFKDLLKHTKKLLGLDRMDQVGIHDIPLDMLASYAARDGRLTYDLWEILEPLLRSEGLHEHFFSVEMPFINVIVKMEESGIRVDQEKLAELEERLTKEKDDLYTRWMAMTDGINPNSHAQLGEYFYGKLKFTATKFTATNKPSVDALSLQRLRGKDKTGSVQLLLDYRNVDKLLKTYVYGIREKLYGGRLYARFNRSGTRTGRFSSSDPNLQNIPIHTPMGADIRRLFVPAPGYLLLVVDYSQIELRLAAHCADDQLLKKVFLEKGDPHTMTAELIGCERDHAKTINYMKFYGASARRVVEKIEQISGKRPNYQDVAHWMTAWDDIFAGITRWTNDIRSFATQHGYVTTLSGRKRRLPDVKSWVESVREAALRQAANAPIQGSAADLIQVAMLNMDSYLDWYGSRMLVQVHDEVVIEAPIECAQELAGIVQREMEGVGKQFNLTVPIVAEPGIGLDWVAAKKGNTELPVLDLDDE